MKKGQHLIWVSEELFNQLKEIARVEERSIAGEARRAIREHIAKHKAKIEEEEFKNVRK